MTNLICRIENSTGRMTLNRPQVLNALTHEMCLEMEAWLTKWATDDTVTQILVDGMGEKAFCAGGDVQHLYERGRAGDFDFGRKFWADEYRLNKLIANYPKPYIVFMQGFTMGGGVGVACHGSHRIVDKTSKIALPECGIGLIPDVGSSYLLARAPGFLGEYLGLTGTRMAAGDAIYAGFADFYIPHEVWQVATSRLIEAGVTETLGEFVQPSPQSELALVQERIDAAFGASNLSQLFDSIQSEDSFAIATLKALNTSSPLSMAASMAVIRATRLSLSIETALEWEYRVTSRSSEYGDFLEGVRALIIDKDKNPKWRHDSVEDITDDELTVLLAPIE